MLLNRYALTIYFNAAFSFSNALKLLFFFKKLNGFQGVLTIAETRFYPDDHQTRKGCKIVACEADQRFLDELYKYPKDHPFSIRYGGNLYVRGGERIDPDDPNAVRPSRPKLTRNAAKKFIHGAGEDILNAGQKADDEAARKAQAEHERKFVGSAVLFTRKHLIIGAFVTCKARLYSLRCYFCVYLDRKKHCNLTCDYRANKLKLDDFYYGYGTGERLALLQAVHINEIANERMGQNIEEFNSSTNEYICINMPMTINYTQKCYIYNENINMFVKTEVNEGLTLLNDGDIIRTRRSCNRDYLKIHNYYPNSTSLVISTRDDYAVIRAIRYRKQTLIFSINDGTLYKKVKGRSLKTILINICKKLPGTGNISGTS